ncbi:MAG TPA: GNAT family N-acetyltransferase [Acidimicrobiia bacterium]|nr:GNAT family N-acetyltransferase [Acidimicrobiia bacterium]
MRVAHLTTVDMSLRFLVLPQLRSVVELDGEAYGISAPGPFVDEVVAAGVRFVPLEGSTRGWSLGDDLRAARALWGILRQIRPDVLHTHNPKPGVYGRIVGRLAGVPLVVNTVHGLYATEDDRPTKRLGVYLLEAIASRFSDAELVQNPEDLALLTRWRISAPEKTSLLGNGVDLERFNSERFTAEERALIREEIGAGPDHVVVGVVGRLVAEKGYPELFAAAEGLGDRYLVLAIGPDEPDKPDALPREMVAAAESAGVRFLGMRDDVDRLYAAMDIFVLPSHREGFPRSAMEAAAMGLPVVATDIRGCRQVVADGETGALVPVEDPDALRAAITAIGESAEARREMGVKARLKAEAEFDERRVVEIVLDTYRRAGRSKGLARLLPPAPPAGPFPQIRGARPEDAAAVAGLHAEIATGFLPRLGVGFLRHLYRALIEWPGADVLVAEDQAGPVGFVAATADTSAFYRFFLRRHGLPALLVALPRLVRPSVLRRAVETLRYGGGGAGAVPAELLAVALSTELRGRGVGGRLLAEMEACYRSRRLPSVRVVVGADNAASLALFRSAGFVDAGEMAVHAGEPSLELVWSE